ncbi:MAG: hypothetical protein NTX36_12185 [Proteobacteria bacterium]|nr:hypothetical protein [Pseudomonadota bacterium]
MRKTLEQINILLNQGIITKYAIAGGMAQFYYIEPSVTYDLDLIVNISGEESNLTPLSKIYEWAKNNNYPPLEEHIVIEGIPVQFLLAYNELVKEALENSSEIMLYEEVTYILKPEYLMAIMLQTGRLTDKQRLAKFLIEADYNKNKYFDILERFGLLELHKKFSGEENG